MHIVEDCYDVLQSKILPCIAKRHRKLFVFGFNALTLQPFVSLNSNARTTLQNRCTAETKIYRLMRNKSIRHYFPLILRHLHLVSPEDSINVDFSSFCGFEVLTFAKQTSLGRAVPVYIAAITYPIENPGSQTTFIIEEVKAFIKLLGFSPHLVFDRGFELPYLAQYLVRNHVSFTIRMRKDKHVLYQGRKIPLRSLPWFENDCLVGMYGTSLRIVISERKKAMEEPWYLLTNTQRADKSRDQIIAQYYFRFEIEETFKDLKHIFTLKKFYRIQKKQTFLTVLWFYLLGLWLSWSLPETAAYLHQRTQTNPHKRLSITKYFLEQIQLTKQNTSFMAP